MVWVHLIALGCTSKNPQVHSPSSTTLLRIQGLGYDFLVRSLSCTQPPPACNADALGVHRLVLICLIPVLCMCTVGCLECARAQGIPCIDSACSWCMDDAWHAFFSCRQMICMYLGWAARSSSSSYENDRFDNKAVWSDLAYAWREHGIRVPGVLIVLRSSLLTYLQGNVEILDVVLYWVCLPAMRMKP